MAYDLRKHHLTMPAATTLSTICSAPGRLRRRSTYSCVQGHTAPETAGCTIHPTSRRPVATGSARNHPRPLHQTRRIRERGKLAPGASGLGDSALLDDASDPPAGAERQVASLAEAEQCVGLAVFREDADRVRAGGV